MRGFWMWSTSKTCRKGMTTNHKQKTPQSESFRFALFDRILLHTAAARVGVHVFVHVPVHSCSAALPERKSDLAPRERSPCRARIKEQPNWSQCTVFFLLSCSLTQMCRHTGRLRAHTHAQQLSRLFGARPKTPLYNQASGVVGICVILNPALQAFLYKSLKRQQEYTICLLPGLTCRQV